MPNQKPIICLPVQTTHNIRSPIQDYVKDGKFQVLLNETFVKISDLSWIKKIFNKAKKFKGTEVHFVIVGHPLVSLVAIQAISKFASKLIVYAWDRQTRKYVRIKYPYEEGIE